MDRDDILKEMERIKLLPLDELLNDEKVLERIKKMVLDHLYLEFKLRGQTCES